MISMLTGVVVSASAQDSSYTNSIGMQFVLIKPGHMTVGKFQPTVSMYGFARPGAAPELPESALKKGEAMAAQDAMPGFNVNI